MAPTLTRFALFALLLALSPAFRVDTRKELEAKHAKAKAAKEAIKAAAIAEAAIEPLLTGQAGADAAAQLAPGGQAPLQVAAPAQPAAAAPLAAPAQPDAAAAPAELPVVVAAGAAAPAVIAPPISEAEAAEAEAHAADQAEAALPAAPPASPASPPAAPPAAPPAVTAAVAADTLAAEPVTEEALAAEAAAAEAHAADQDFLEAEAAVLGGPADVTAHTQAAEPDTEEALAPDTADALSAGHDTADTLSAGPDTVGEASAAPEAAPVELDEAFAAEPEAAPPAAPKAYKSVPGSCWKAETNCSTTAAGGCTHRIGSWVDGKTHEHAVAACEKDPVCHGYHWSEKDGETSYVLVDVVGPPFGKPTSRLLQNGQLGSEKCYGKPQKVSYTKQKDTSCGVADEDHDDCEPGNALDFSQDPLTKVHGKDVTWTSNTAEFPTRDTAQTICGARCRASDKCVGFVFIPDINPMIIPGFVFIPGRCEYLKNAMCNVFKHGERDCYQPKADEPALASVTSVSGTVATPEAAAAAATEVESAPATSAAGAVISPVAAEEGATAAEGQSPSARHSSPQPQQRSDPQVPKAAEMQPVSQRPAGELATALAAHKAADGKSSPATAAAGAAAAQEPEAASAEKPVPTPEVPKSTAIRALPLVALLTVAAITL